MKTRHNFILAGLMLVALTLAACGGETAGTGTVPAAPDLADLPGVVDAATVKALQGNPAVVILDVREQAEYDAGHIPGVTFIPMGQVADRLAEIPEDKTVIVTCRSGNRSQQVADFLRQQGYTNIHNMKGGIIAWEQAGYPTEK